MIVITQAETDEERDFIVSLLNEGCHLCRRHGPPLSLLAHHDGPLVLCDKCTPTLKTSPLAMARRLLAALVEEEDAEGVTFGLEVTRHWHAGRIPLPAHAVLSAAEWGQA